MRNRKLFETKGIKEVIYIFSGYIIPKGWKVLTWSRAIHIWILQIIPTRRNLIHRDGM